MPRFGCLLLVVLLMVLAPAGGPRARTPERWYIAKVEHDHEHMEHAAHAAPGPRKWEPERAIDPRGIHGYQEMYEVTRFPHAEQPTPEQRRQAQELVKRCRESAKRHGWFEYEQAAKDGFKLMYGDTMHYVNEGYALDEAQLDPDRPEFLLFYETPSGKRLAAFMFLTRSVGEHGRQIGGPLTIWHYHAWSKAKCRLGGRFIVGDPDRDGRCKSGDVTPRSPEMMHVWLVKHPDGPFATDMSLTEDMQKELAQPERP